MKMCNTEIMKEIKDLENKIDTLVEFEANNLSTNYFADEEPLDSTYCYEDVNKQINELQARIRYLKGKLAYANATVIVDGFNMTINESLIYLAQINKRYTRLQAMAKKNPIERLGSSYSRTGTVAEYCKLNYNPFDAKRDAEELGKKIALLQMAIDRTNLTNLIDC